MMAALNRKVLGNNREEQGRSPNDLVSKLKTNTLDLQREYRKISPLRLCCVALFGKIHSPCTLIIHDFMTILCIFSWSWAKAVLAGSSDQVWGSILWLSLSPVVGKKTSISSSGRLTYLAVCGGSSKNCGGVWRPGHISNRGVQVKGEHRCAEETGA